MFGCGARNAGGAPPIQRTSRAGGASARDLLLGVIAMDSKRGGPTWNFKRVASITWFCIIAFQKS